MKRWEREVLEILIEEIKSGFGGRLPETLEDFACAFQRFGVTVRFQREMRPTDALLCGDLLCLAPFSENPQWQRVCLHEIAEAALLWEGCAPYCYPPESPCAARHRLAGYFETCASSSAKHALRTKRQGRRAALPSL